ncbi:MAG: 50S ribosomal protein L17 [Polyangiaceae bacterium]
MRHHNSGRKFDRNSSHRRAMLRNLTANLVLHERIETTDAKAKELRRAAERLITKARRLGAVAYTAQDKLSDADKARRLATARVINAYVPRFVVRVEKGGESKQVDLVEKILLDLGKRFADRPGGYTRIIKKGPRRGDGAPMVLIEFVGEAVKTDDAAPKKAKKSKKAEGTAAKAG